MKNAVVFASVATFKTFASSQTVATGGMLCISDIPGIQDWGFPANAMLRTLTCDPENMTDVGVGGIALGLGTTASGANSHAFGQQTTASGDVSTAFGSNSTAGGNASFVAGVNCQTFSDPRVPGGDGGAGGAVAMGKDNTAIGDWAFAMGRTSVANGYVSATVGEGLAANTWGEVALGLFTETEPTHTEEELRTRSVIPIFDENDVVLRVGIGCTPHPSLAGEGCPETRHHDAVRIYKSGRMYLKNLKGEVMEDVQAEIMKSKDELAAIKDELIAIKEEIAALKTSVSTSSASANGRNSLLVFSMAAALCFV